MNSLEFFLDFQDYSLLFKEVNSEKPGKPPVIFLHDSLGCISLWRDFPEKLLSKWGRRGFIYDRKGYGKSSPLKTTFREPDYMEREAHLLISIMDRLEIQEAVLFGHSDGGTIALLAAALYPERIKGIITEGAHIFVEEITLEGIRDAQILFQKTDLLKRLEKYHGDKAANVVKAWVDIWLSSRFRDWNIEAFLPNIVCSGLIIQGKKDEYGTLLQVETIANEAGGNLQPCILPGIGHTPHKENPEACLEVCIDYLSNL